MTADHPPWEQLGSTFELVEQYLQKAAPKHLAKCDQINAEIRDYFDERGVCIGDEWTSYAVLVACELFAQQVINAARAELIDVQSARALHAILIGNAALFTEPARRATAC